MYIYVYIHMCVYIYICIVSFHSPPCDINEDMKINAGSNLICKMLFLRWWLVCPSSYPVFPIGQEAL